MIYFSAFLREWSTSSDIPKIIISAIAFVSQGIKQPCETKAIAEIIIFGKPADERIASTAPLYVQKKCYIFGKNRHRVFSRYEGFKNRQTHGEIENKIILFQNEWWKFRHIQRRQLWLQSCSFCLHT